jgi:DNA primase
LASRKGFDLAPLLLDMKCAQFQRTDMGNAERWHARYGQDYLYTTAKGWLGWDGRRYRVLNQEKDSTPAEVMASVFRTVRAIQDEAHFVRNTGWPEAEVVGERLEEYYLANAGEDPRRPSGMDEWLISGRKGERLSSKISAWGRTSEGAGKLACIANLAKRWVTVELSDFDTDPMLLNCLNGTLRFYPPDDDGPARLDLKPHDRADKLTKLTACDFDPEAPAPLFQKTVRWAQPDRDRRRYLRQWLGYNLTGDMGEQIFQIWYGPKAANGKSTVGNVCREAMGDYGDTINVESFLDEGQKKRGDQATPDLVRLPGVRLLTAGEPPKGAKINEALINSVTGGDPMNVRDNFRSHSSASCRSSSSRCGATTCRRFRRARRGSGAGSRSSRGNST